MFGEDVGVLSLCPSCSAMNRVGIGYSYQQIYPRVLAYNLFYTKMKLAMWPQQRSVKEMVNCSCEQSLVRIIISLYGKECLYVTHRNTSGFLILFVIV